MTPERLLRTAIIPALTELAAAGIADTIDVRRFLLAIALQESRLEHRRQVTAYGLEDGPAASFWQFEKGGGCVGVLTHLAVSGRMRRICENFNVTPTAPELWQAMRYNDVVAAAAARLLLYTLPGVLATTAENGWIQYLSAWRPGKPHPKTWAGHWATADEAVRKVV